MTLNEIELGLAMRAKIEKPALMCGQCLGKHTDRDHPWT